MESKYLQLHRPNCAFIYYLAANWSYIVTDLSSRYPRCVVSSYQRTARRISFNKVIKRFSLRETYICCTNIKQSQLYLCKHTLLDANETNSGDYIEDVLILNNPVPKNYQGFLFNTLDFRRFFEEVITSTNTFSQFNLFLLARKRQMAYFGNNITINILSERYHRGHFSATLYSR